MHASGKLVRGESSIDLPGLNNRSAHHRTATTLRPRSTAYDASLALSNDGDD
jgi:hypothetical protein